MSKPVRGKHFELKDLDIENLLNAILKMICFLYKSLIAWSLSPKFLSFAFPSITIKDNCWLVSNVVVCGGVTIGEGCVIGAGSVVTRDIPPYSLAAGNPCRVIRKITEKDHMK